MRLSLIGMSNIGKSSWARRLAIPMGLTPFNCDALIEEKLNAAFPGNRRHDLRGMASWMGLPSDARYAENSKIYQQHEQAIMQNIIAALRAEPTRPAILDTTGSVIYTGDKILANLRSLTRVVYLEASDEHTDILFKNFIANPKPVIWGDVYAPQTNETLQETLHRCYPLLLRNRAQRYKDIAHVTIPFEIHHNDKADLSAFLEE